MARPNFRDRTQELIRVKAADLQPDVRNWRLHPRPQQHALVEALTDIGFAGAVLARRDDDGKLVLIDGHARVEVLPPDHEVPVLVLDVSEREAGKLLATYDQLSTMAEQDSEKLAALMRDMKAESESAAALLEAVFPDYVIDTLLAAEWKPEEPKPMGEHHRMGDSLKLTQEQRAVVDQAIAKVRSKIRGPGADPEPSEGRCIELVCSDYLAAP